MARETGALGKEGLETEIISMPSSAAIPALVANEIDVVQVSAAPVITASLRGLDVVFIAGLLNTMIWDFYVRPEIKTNEQLKGKIVGTDRPGTPVAYGTMVALNKLGLTAKDVQLRILGSSPAIVAAFYAGQISGGIGSPPASFQMERSGMRSVVSLLDVPYQNVGLVVRRSRMDELANRFLPMLRIPGYFLAGTMGMRYSRLLLLDGLGILLSVPLSIYLGKLFGGQVERLKETVHDLHLILALLALVLVLVLVIRLRWARANPGPGPGGKAEN